MEHAADAGKIRSIHLAVSIYTSAIPFPYLIATGALVLRNAWLFFVLLMLAPAHSSCAVVGLSQCVLTSRVCPYPRLGHSAHLSHACYACYSIVKIPVKALSPPCFVSVYSIAYSRINCNVFLYPLFWNIEKTRKYAKKFFC